MHIVDFQVHRRRRAGCQQLSERRLLLHWSRCPKRGTPHCTRPAPRRPR
jgi:hypothetical protein